MAFASNMEKTEHLLHLEMVIRNLFRKGEAFSLDMEIKLKVTFEH